MDNRDSAAYDVLHAPAEPTPENFEALFYEGMQEVMHMCDQFDATLAVVADTILNSPPEEPEQLPEPYDVEAADKLLLDFDRQSKEFFENFDAIIAIGQFFEEERERQRVAQTQNN